MPHLNTESVHKFEKNFKRWKDCFVGPRLRPPEDQPGPDLSFVSKRLEAKEEMEEAFKDMVKENDF